MLDELDRLDENRGLFNLLAHYGDCGLVDRQAWQDRLAQLEGVSPRDLVRLHGELLAWGWVEQNTGVTPILRKEAACQCYRITTAGLRALKQVRSGERDVL